MGRDPRHPGGRLDLEGRPGLCAVLGPGCTTLALAAANGDIHVWDVPTGRQLLRLKAVQGRGSHLAFAPDGKFLVAVGSDHVVRLWELPSGTLVHQLAGADRAEGYFAFSPDRALLAWGCGSEIHLWDLIRGKASGRLAGHAFETTAVAFDRDSRTLISGGRDQTLRVWDTATGIELRRLRSRERGSIDLQRVAGGRVLASLSACPKNSRHVLHEAFSGRVVLPERAWNWVRAVTLDGKTLATAGWRIEFHETATGGLIGELALGPRGSVTALAFSPDGRLLATGSDDTSILLWDWRSVCGLGQLDGRKPWDLWRDLASANARTAYAIIGALAAQRDAAVALLTERVQPVTEAECRPVCRLLAELDHPRFAVREKAEAELRQLGGEWLPLVYGVLRAKPSPEVRRRLEALLAEPVLMRWSPSMLRRLRAVQLLEQAGTPAVRRLLERLAGGLPEARLSQEAKAALERLARRPGRR